MKERPIFEEVFSQLARQSDFWLKLLIGGLLSFIPVVNFFAFGYLYRFSLKVRRSGQLALPEWSDWPGLFTDGLKFAVVWLTYWLLPLLIASAVSAGLSALGLGALSYLLLSSLLFVSPLLFCSALYRLQMRSDFKDLLDVPLIIRITYHHFPRLMVPALAFLGICALGLPLYGCALFSGFLLLIAHTGLSYRAMQMRKAAAA